MLHCLLLALCVLQGLSEARLGVLTSVVAEDDVRGEEGVLRAACLLALCGWTVGRLVLHPSFQHRLRSEVYLLIHLNKINLSLTVTQTLILKICIDYMSFVRRKKILIAKVPTPVS